ncbi:MAG TPA: Smr/MutS family protein [Devosiaceae bacterium]|nr:Smr/MutS family protein [Devosiaceae bacterium]
MPKVKRGVARIRETPSATAPSKSPGTSAPDDLHLWTEVARTVRPLQSRSPVVPRTPPRAPDAKRAAGPPAGKPAPVKTRDTHPKQARPLSAMAQSASKPLEPNLKRKIARGREAIDSTLDLHGMRQADAHQALERFVLAASARGDRNVLVITGKGTTRGADTAAPQPGVLRQAVPRWLSAPALSPYVSGSGAAARSHGGEGAIYVRLKRLKP